MECRMLWWTADGWARCRKCSAVHWSCSGRTRPLTGYYWGLYSLPNGVRRSDYHSCFFTPEGGLREKVFFCNSLFEAVFTAPHGMTLAYRQEDGRFVPCYAPTAESRKAFICRLEGLLLPYIARLAEEAAPDEEQQRAEHETVQKLLARFMGRRIGQRRRLSEACPFRMMFSKRQGGRSRRR